MSCCDSTWDEFLCPSCSVPNLFSSGGDSISGQVCQTVQKTREFPGRLMFAFEAYSHDQESGETRCYHLFPLLETSSIPVTNFLGKVCLLGPCAVLQGCDCAFHL